MSGTPSSHLPRHTVPVQLDFGRATGCSPGCWPRPPMGQGGLRANLQGQGLTSWTQGQLRLGDEGQVKARRKTNTWSTGSATSCNEDSDTGLRLNPTTLHVPCPGPVLPRASATGQTHTHCWLPARLKPEPLCPRQPLRGGVLGVGPRGPGPSGCLHVAFACTGSQQVVTLWTFRKQVSSRWYGLPGAATTSNTDWKALRSSSSSI